MTAPLFDKGGHTIVDPTDGYMNDSDLNAAVDAQLDINIADLPLYLAAVRTHWTHQHNVTVADAIDIYLNHRGLITKYVAYAQPA